MPFLITEPQRIEGTCLGFSVYPYDFSFDDHFENRNYNRKLMIFKLKDSQFVEVDCVVGEHRFKHETATRKYVDQKLQSFVSKNPQFVTDNNKLKNFFADDLKK